MEALVSSPNQSGDVLKPGQLFEQKFEILSVLGAGGVGIVYKAKHIHMDKVVAIKTLLASFVSDEVSFLRFEREAKTASSLTHPNIVTIHDFGKSVDGSAYLVMEYLGERSVADILQQSRTLDLDHFLRLFTQVCDGLQFAHRKGIVHRDIKPSNLMVVSTEDVVDLVKIVDFGLSKVTQANDTQELTKTGVVIGTPLFMSPEQCQGLELDHRSDIYSLACLMYQALTGRVPHRGESSLNTIYKHMVEAPPSFADIAPELVLPAPLEEAIQKALRKSPNERQQSMADLRNDIVNAILYGGSHYSTYRLTDVSATEAPSISRPISVIRGDSPSISPRGDVPTSDITVAGGDANPSVTMITNSSALTNPNAQLNASGARAPTESDPEVGQQELSKQQALKQDGTLQPKLQSDRSGRLAIECPTAGSRQMASSGPGHSPHHILLWAGGALAVGVVTATITLAVVRPQAQTSPSPSSLAASKTVAEPAASSASRESHPDASATNAGRNPAPLAAAGDTGLARTSGSAPAKPPAAHTAPHVVASAALPKHPTVAPTVAPANRAPGQPSSKQLARLAQSQYKSGQWEAARRSFIECTSSEAAVFGPRDPHLFVPIARSIDCRLKEHSTDGLKSQLDLALTILTENKSAAHNFSAGNVSQVWLPLADASMVCAQSNSAEKDGYLRWAADLYAVSYNLLATKPGEADAHRAVGLKYLSVLNQLPNMRPAAVRVSRDLGVAEPPKPEKKPKKPGTNRKLRRISRNVWVR